jgi:hypothetical protein
VFSGTSQANYTWATATFTDAGADTVTLKMTASDLLAPSEFVSEWYFNVDPYVYLGFGQPVIEGGTMTAPTISQGGSYKADGDGYFDIRFSFSTAETGRFGAGQSITYLITGDDLNATDFLFGSAPSGGSSGGLYTAAHIQGISVPGGSPSVWVTTPVPATAWLLGSGLLGLVAIRRRMKK